MRGRLWLPISRRSLKPLVMTRACLAPLRSSKAFVATVVLRRMRAILSTGTLASLGMLSPVASSSTRRTPSRGASV